MTKLRQQMIDAMRQRGYSVRTHQAYLAAVTGLAGYYQRSPDRLSVEEIKDYLRHLAVERARFGERLETFGHRCRLGRESYGLRFHISSGEVGRDSGRVGLSCRGRIVLASYGPQALPGKLAERSFSDPPSFAGRVKQIAEAAKDRRNNKWRRITVA